MVELVHARAAGDASSSGFRDAIFSRHEELRAVVAQTVALAERLGDTNEDLEALRAGARRLYLALEGLLTFEDVALSPALRDVVGWGPVLQEELEGDHARQRQTVAEALSALEPASLSFDELAGHVRTFAEAVLRAIENEQRALVNGDLDAMSADSPGG